MFDDSFKKAKDYSNREISKVLENFNPNEKLRFNPLNISPGEGKTFGDRFSSFSSVFVGDTEPADAKETSPSLLDRLFKINNKKNYGVLDYLIGAPINVVCNLLPLLPLILINLGSGLSRAAFSSSGGALDRVSSPLGLLAYLLINTIFAIAGPTLAALGLVGNGIALAITMPLNAFTQKLLLPTLKLLTSPIAFALAGVASVASLVKNKNAPDQPKAVSGQTPSHSKKTQPSMNNMLGALYKKESISDKRRPSPPDIRENHNALKNSSSPFWNEQVSNPANNTSSDEQMPSPSNNPPKK